MAEKWVALQFKSDLFPTQLIQGLDKVLSKLQTAVDVIMKILELLQLFISGFNTFTAVLGTFISFAQKMVDNLAKDLGDAGVFLNIFIPPAFLNTLKGNADFTKLSTGGFQGFIERMRVSFYNTADVNRPVFDDSSIVGGMLVVADSETLVEFYQSIEFLNGLFSFMDLFSFNTNPPPPKNIRGSAGYILQKDGTDKFGVKIEWDAPTIRGIENYRISRSVESGGTVVEKNVMPTKLVGPKGHEEEGLLTAIKLRLFGPDKEWPKMPMIVYEDKTFNKGKPAYVVANLVTGGGSYIDYDVDKTKVLPYYYVLQSGFRTGFSLNNIVTGETGLWGPYSPETSIAADPRNCISGNAVGVVTHKGGKIELLSVGVGALGQWTSIKVGVMMPFMTTITDLLSGFLKSLKGSLQSNTKAFTDFLNGIVEKFVKYKTIVETLATMILVLENFFSMAPKVAFLNVPPKNGLGKFLQAVNDAKKPEGGFSGSGGLTLGIAMVYGVPALTADVEAAKTQIKIIEKAFGLFLKLLSK